MSDDIGRWLAKLGLERYEDRFTENEITFSVLPKLSDADLKELELPMGPRKIISAAISDLTAVAPDTFSADTIMSSDRHQDAERRQLTIMFCDLVGSTELSGKFDPEDMREIIRAYQDAVTGEITRFGGQIAKFMGDGVLAYFGWPDAHEEDAERATRAGLAAVTAAADLRTPTGDPLAAKIGIATGLVVVGESFGEGIAQERSVIGETPNLAARLESIAMPGQVVISDTTQRLLGGMFIYGNLGSRRLKGFSEPIPAWSVVGENSVLSRFEAQHGGPRAPLVGRDEELQLLVSRWLRAKNGEGQVVLLSGEPGVGKSHLSEALREYLASESHNRLRYFCSPFHANSTFYPVVGQLERAIGIRREDIPATKLDKLEQFFSEHPEDASNKLPLIADLLSIDTGERYPPLNLSPQRQRARTMETLLYELGQLAIAAPLLVILEDAHWLDPTTQELFGMMIEQAQALPVLFIITFRPEYSPPWHGFSHVTALSLSRLARNQCLQIMDQIAGGATLPSRISDQVLDKADGVPLFVEELTKAVVDTSSPCSTNRQGQSSAEQISISIPATLQDSLMARLDRLGEVKNIAQIGSVIGREFTYDILAEIKMSSEQELRDALDKLVESELVFCRGTPPASSYRFKHALIQDAAYQSLLKSNRQELHRRIAAVLEHRFEHIVATEPEVLARHYTSAGQVEKAIYYWNKAGRRAVKQSANAEAVRHLNNGLALIRTVDDDERNRLELMLRLSLGPALMALEGQSSKDVGAIYKRALVLARDVREGDDQFRALWGSWRHHFIRAEHSAALRLAKHCLAFVQEHQIKAFEPGAHFALGGSLLWSGDVVSASDQFERAALIYDPRKHGQLAFELGQDPGVSTLAYSAFAQWFLGFPSKALDRSQRALETARSLNHPATLAAVSTYDAILQSFRRDWVDARRRADATIALSHEQRFPQHLAIGKIIRGRALAEDGAFDEGISDIKEGIATRRAIGASISLPHFLALLAETYCLADRIEEGLLTIQEAIQISLTTDEGFFQPDLFRIEGELLAKAQIEETAKDRFQVALDLARRGGSMSLELRAALHMARVMAVNRQEEGYDLIDRIYAHFEEGFDTADLSDAKAFLSTRDRAIE